MAGFNWAARPTPGGYQFGECVSALQKCIRRGHDEEAMYWAFEVEATDRNYLWRRLLLIASEDIGPANIAVVNLVHHLRQAAMERTRDDGSKLLLAHAILEMARSPKSRIVDDFVIAVGTDPSHREVPDFAYDKHTAKGKAMGRGFDHFFEVGAIIHPDTDGARTDDWRQRTRAALNRGAGLKYSGGTSDKRSGAGQAGFPVEE